MELSKQRNDDKGIVSKMSHSPLHHNLPHIKIETNVDHTLDPEQRAAHEQRTLSCCRVCCPIPLSIDVGQSRHPFRVVAVAAVVFVFHQTHHRLLFSKTDTRRRYGGYYSSSLWMIISVLWG